VSGYSIVGGTMAASDLLLLLLLLSCDHVRVTNMGVGIDGRTPPPHQSLPVLVISEKSSLEIMWLGWTFSKYFQTHPSGAFECTIPWRVP
jgi:hypothetical protein